MVFALLLFVLRQIPTVVLGLEYAAGGELFDILMYTGCFDEVLARTLFQQLASALQVCKHICVPSAQQALCGL